MGQWYRFECGRCGHEAQVSGGLDVGMAGYAHTVLCRTCRPPRLVNAFKEREPETKGYDVADYRCLHAKTRRHRLELWTHPGPCPRCGHTLTRGEATAIWD